MNLRPQTRAESWWYVQAQGRVWGPYTESRLEVFVREGRVAAATLVADRPAGPFLEAGRQAPLAWLFETSPAAPDLIGQPQIPQPPAAEVVTQTGAARPLLVFARLAALDDAGFEAALAVHGAFERIGHGLWLVRARLGPSALRNALSRRLRGGDTLLVVEAPLEKAAWFNLDQAEERKLRALWIS